MSQLQSIRQECKFKIKVGSWEIELRGPPSKKQKNYWSLVALVLAVLVMWQIAPEAVQAVLDLLGK